MGEKQTEILELISKNPEGIRDRAVLDRMNEELAGNGAFLVVRTGENITYNGSSELTDQQLMAALPGYSERNPEENGGKTEQKTGVDRQTVSAVQIKDQAMINQIDFSLPDGSPCSVFLMSMLNRIAPELRNAMIETVLLILVILSVTSMCMGLWIYRGVMRPIRDLQTAAKNIRDGNLNFNVSGTGVREINDLCDDFEEMRVRLKESAEEKINNDSKSKELISNISHDLKTPVTAIKGYAEGIIDGVAATPEKQKKYIRTIYNKAVEIERLIDELTTYSKIEANRVPYNFQKIHVREYFTDCIDELSLELDSRSIQLHYFNYLTGEPLVIADPEQMRRVINNIVGNSVKYMDKPNGVVNIRLRDVGEFIQIEIEDNGKGIAQKDISRIFDRFYRSDTARRSRGGSGIGLSIVKKIIEDHEGKVWATSREGVGTVVYFVLRKYQEVENEQNTDH
jgi:signal transduction histidine kinase